MKHKILKKIVESLGFKLVEKKLLKNQRLIGQYSMLNNNFILHKIFSNLNIQNVIQIGANDGERFDDLKNFIKFKNLNCLLVEPVNRYYKKLVQNYSNENNFKFENAAISKEKQKLELYCVKEEFLKNYDDHVQGINSSDKNHLIKHDVKKNHIEKIIVNSISFKDLIIKYNITKIDLLYIDAEGYDGKILLDFFDISKFNPVIIFEFIHIEPKIFEKLIDKLNQQKYRYFSINENLICYPKDKKIPLN